MQNILVPIGVSKFAIATLTFAINFAKHFNSSVYVIDAYPLHTSRASITNLNARLEEENRQRIKGMIGIVAPNSKNIKIVGSEQDLIGTIKKLNHTIGLDLIITAPHSNEIDEEIFLGRIAGSLIKRTKVAVLVAPLDKKFSPPKKMLLAFKSGEVRYSSLLDTMIRIQDKFKVKLKLLLVKVPGFSNRNHQLNDQLMKRSEQLIYSENATVYQGVLEHFQLNNPDMLVVFKRERGFFEKLWESDVVYKKDFYCKVPLLVLKNKN